MLIKSNGFPFEVIKGVGCFVKGEGKGVSTKGLMVVAHVSVLFVNAVFAIPKQGMSYKCHMGADLMGSARMKGNIKQRKIGFFF